MALSFNVLPSGDVENDGWTINGASTVWEAVSSSNDAIYVKCPSYRGGAECSFPVDVTDLPDGAVIDSVTVFVRMNTSAGSGPRSVTCNVLSSENRSRYTQRTLYAHSTITDHEVGTYTRDPLGRGWDIHRLNKLRLRFFCLNDLADSCRVYKLYCRINYHVRPTVVVTSPSGTVTTPSPTVTWTYTQSKGEPQKSAEYKIFTSAVASTSTFNPSTDTAVFSKTVTGIGNSYIIPTTLSPDSYQVYVRAQSQFGAWSLWASKQFTLSAPAPGVPGDNNAGLAGTPGVGTPTVVPDSYTSSAAIRAQDASNLLSAQQADFEVSTDPLGWVAATNIAIARDTTIAFADGVASMSLTAQSTATMAATSTFVEVAEAQPLTLRAQFLSVVTPRTVNLQCNFYDSEYALIGGSTITATGVDSSSTWTEVVGTGSSPANAKYAEMVAEVVSPVDGEKHYIDRVGLMYGTNTAWSDGGYTSKNLLSQFLATGDDPAAASDAWEAANTATTVTRVTATGTGAHGAKCNQMTYAGASPTIAYRSTSSVYTSSSSGTAFTLNKPSGLADGDLMLAFVTSTEFGTISPPSGWATVNTAAVNDGSTDIALWVLKRTGLAADPSSWTTGALGTSSTRRTAVVVAYSGAASADSQFVAESVRTETADPLVHQTATVNNTDPYAWRVCAFAASDNTSGMSMVANQTAPASIPSIQFVNKATYWASTASGTSFTLNKPSGVISGDVMIASVLLSGIVASVTTPSGWTLVRKITTAASGDLSSGQLTACIYRRTAGGSEPNSWSSTFGTYGRPRITQVVAYRNVDPSSPIIQETAGTNANSSSVGTGSVTNNNSGAWRVSIFGAMTGYGNSWNSSADYSERADDTTGLDGYYDTSLAVYDSSASVSTGSHSRTGTVAGWSTSFVSAFGWIGLLKPLPSPPAAGANETERVDNQNGASSLYMCTSVYDSNGVASTGSQSIYGILTTGDSLGANSMASWIGFIKPATSTSAGVAAARTNVKVDISEVDDEVLDLAESKLTMMASFLGSSSGTPTLSVDFYRANQLISTSSALGQAFNSSVWTKSWAVFDIPDGTTRIRPSVSALDRAISDTVQFDRVGLMFGGEDGNQEPQWQAGTSRTEHPVWSKPVLQYQEDDGTGYGDWVDLAGQKLRPPSYSLSSSQMYYVDHTIVPTFARRYRVATKSYGLNGDFFSSGYGPASQEAILESFAWWLKDIGDPSNNIQISVKWNDLDVSTTNAASVFQPLGEDHPVVISEGFKGDAFSLDIHCEQDEFVVLMRLLSSRKTLVLQSDIDKTWWVRPVGDIQSKILATGSRRERPRRYVSVKFVQVKPEE